ncbi:MAG: glutathione S-transferase family protein [Alphaproteobacteria bacterium]|nr:glutathione S-transferase family protein [Alphaproteobacteria bacterium]
MGNKVLYYYSLNPFSRKVRFVMNEKGMTYDLSLLKPWEIDTDFLLMNPAGDLPVLKEETGQILSNHTAICEYLDEVKAIPSLFGQTPFERAEVRRLVEWFDVKFYNEVESYFLNELVYKRLSLLKKEPETKVLRAARHNLKTHIEYLNYLIDRRNFLAGRSLSLADFDVVAHLSVLDYLGEVPWEQYQALKSWYAIMKSRPSFRSILNERILEFSPPSYYDDLDF